MKLKSADCMSTEFATKLDRRSQAIIKCVLTRIRVDEFAVFGYTTCNMEKLNPRVARSRNKLGDALCSLALERDYTTLTITEITKRAGVGYSTFFRHYKTVDELLTDILLTTMRDIRALLQDKESTYDEMVAFFTYVNAHPDRFRFYATLPDTHPDRVMMKEEASKLVVDRYEAAITSSVPLVVTVNHMVESSVAFLRWYLDQNDDRTPEQLASFYIDLILATAETKALSPRKGWHKRQTDVEIDRKS